MCMRKSPELDEQLAERFFDQLEKSCKGYGWRQMGVAIFFLLTLLLPANRLFAQNGSIQGIVVDSQGATIPNANVQATDVAKGALIREVKSGENGEFQLQPLPSGTYSIQVTAPGMSTLKRDNVMLELSQTLNLGPVTLAIGSENTTVTVDTQPLLIETTTSEHSDVITSKEVTETPLNGRDFTSLIRTLPGIVSNNNQDFNLQFNSTTGFFVNGYRSSANNVYLDGAINTDVGANDGQYTQLSLDGGG